MGEKASTVFNVGCPRMDIVKNVMKDKNLFQKMRFLSTVGKKFNLNDKFLIVSQHPVTTEYEKAFDQITNTLEAVKKQIYLL